MTTHAPVKGIPVLLVVVVAVLMVFVAASGAAAATPASSSSTPVGTWSYGAVKTVSVGPLQASDDWYYQGTATFGYTVSIWDNNTSTPNTFELTILRTMGAAFSVEFCLPSCTSPTNWVNLSYRAWEATTGISNFTTVGSVAENGSAVPAIGLLSSEVWVHSNLTETYDAHLPILKWAGDKTRYLAGDIVGHTTVSFTPALGLFPTALNPGTSWDSTSAFAAAGSANYSVFYGAHGPVASQNNILGPVSGSLSAAGHGNVTVDGTYATGSSIEVGGVTYPAITLTVNGPFSVREGVIFIPTKADLFGNSNPPVAGNASGATTVEQTNVDVRPFAGGHFGLAASSWRYATNSVNPADAPATAATSSGMAPAATTTNPVSSVTVQGEPQTSAQATSTQQCLTAGTGCPTGGGSSPRSILGPVVVIGAVATVGALIALAVVTRRRVPPPTYPNAVLYPPGAAGPSAPVTPGSHPPSEDDPLNHLW